MELRYQIESIYRVHGTRRLQPFLGSGYESNDSQFRVLALGYNSYIDDGDWPADDQELREWYHEWWVNAPSTNSGRFYNQAFVDCDRLARAVRASPLYANSHIDQEVNTIDGLYGTNVVKEFTDAKFKRSTALGPDDFVRYDETWLQEINALADYDRLPHLITVFGSAIWGHACLPFGTRANRRLSTRPSFEVVEVTSGQDSLAPSFYQAHKVALKTSCGNKSLLLVRLHHPSARTRPKRDASWLLDQSDFRSLARIDDGQP